MVSTTCPSCHNGLEIEPQHVGKNVLCPFCQKLFVPPKPLKPQSPFGVASCFLAALAVLIELFAIVYFLLGSSWETSFLSQKHVGGLIALASILGMVLSWIGIGCAGFAFAQKRRRKESAKWGLIANLSLNVFVCGFLLVKPYLADRKPEPPAESEESSTKVLLPRPDLSFRARWIAAGAKR